MSIYVVDYSDKYRSQVVACLRRNYSWMGSANDTEVRRWASPLFEYSWKECIPDNPNGIVLLDDGNVVGFIGCIYSYRYHLGVRYKYLSCTTWCIDEGYRVYLAKLLIPAFSRADVITDFTPRKSVEQFLVSIFHFKQINSESIRFFPFPLDSKYFTLQMEEVSDPEKIDNEVLRLEFIDNVKYDVKCSKFSFSDNTGYIFYKRMRYSGDWILVTKIVNEAFFAANAYEITWRIQQEENFDGCNDLYMCMKMIIERVYNKQWIAMECERAFVGKYAITHPFFRTHDVMRLALVKKPSLQIRQFDFLYSEMVMLELR